jgi:molybdate transport system permease protein
MADTFLGLTALDWRAVYLSAWTCAAGVAFTLPFGLGLGWLLARKTFPGKALVETALNLPLVLPPVVTGYVLLLTFGRKGWIGGWLWSAFGLEVAFTWRAAVVAVGVMGFPLLVRAIRLAFQGIDPRLYQAARSLGAGPLDAFFSVSLPLARSGVIAGVVLAFARGVGEFGATLIFYGNPEQAPTLPLQFYNTWENETGAANAPHLWHLVLVSVLLAGVALAVSEYLERRGQRRESA